ncbi:MAG: hypothetical protein H6850_00400 [Alphaproteobacteria bacterium]|nr:MAG: hypothetical protein H6850_00400 [Alphaproteobacteria bacterium]
MFGLFLFATSSFESTVQERSPERAALMNGTNMIFVTGASEEEGLAIARSITSKLKVLQKSFRETRVDLDMFKHVMLKPAGESKSIIDTRSIQDFIDSMIRGVVETGDSTQFIVCRVIGTDNVDPILRYIDDVKKARQQVVDRVAQGGDAPNFKMEVVHFERLKFDKRLQKFYRVGTNTPLLTELIRRNFLTSLVFRSAIIGPSITPDVYATEGFSGPKSMIFDGPDLPESIEALSGDLVGLFLGRASDSQAGRFH